MMIKDLTFASANVFGLQTRILLLWKPLLHINQWDKRFVPV